MTTIRVRVILILFLILSVYAKSQTFNFKQVTTKSVCLEQLMNKIVEVNNHFRDCAKHHYIVCEQSGDITQLQIESFDDEGIYPYLFSRNICGVFMVQDNKFYIDTSLKKEFDQTDIIIKNKYKRRQRGHFNEICFNDCWMKWSFEYDECGIDLYQAFTNEIWQYWYDMELSPDCFCNYKKITIDVIDEESEELDD